MNIDMPVTQAEFFVNVSSKRKNTSIVFKVEKYTWKTQHFPK